MLAKFSSWMSGNLGELFNVSSYLNMHIDEFLLLLELKFSFNLNGEDNQVIVKVPLAFKEQSALKHIFVVSSVGRGRGERLKGSEEYLKKIVNHRNTFDKNLRLVSDLFTSWNFWELIKRTY